MVGNVLEGHGFFSEVFGNVRKVFRGKYYQKIIGSFRRIFGKCSKRTDTFGKHLN